MGVANLSEFGNSVNPTDVIAAGISPALVKAVCMPNLMYTEGLPLRTQTARLTRKGSLTASALAESTALAPDTNGRLTDTGVTATITKAAVVTGVTVEQEQFGSLTPDRIAQEHGTAIARFVDSDALSLAGAITATVTAASALTLNDVMLAQFAIINSECPNKETPLKVVLAHRGAYNIRNEVTQSGASVWTNSTELSILGGAPQNNCYVGSAGALDFYSTSGFTTSGGDNVQMVIHPQWCLAGFFQDAPVTWIENEGRGGFFTAFASYYFYDVLIWNNACGVRLLSDI